MKFRRILFDLDGTLIIHNKEDEGENICNILKIESKEQQALFVRRLRKLFQSNNYYEFFKKMKVKKINYYFAIMHFIHPEDFKLTPEDVYRAMYINVKQNSLLAPNATETLSYLQDSGYELFVLTNGFQKDQLSVLNYKGIGKYFERVYGWDNFYAKPDKRAYYRTIENLRPIDIAVVGDDIFTDIKPAKEIGMYTIKYGSFNSSNVDIIPDRQIEDLIQLKDIL